MPDMAFTNRVSFADSVQFLMQFQKFNSKGMIMHNDRQTESDIQKALRLLEEKYGEPLQPNDPITPPANPRRRPSAAQSRLGSGQGAGIGLGRLVSALFGLL
jgi:hypothetical protein